MTFIGWHSDFPPTFIFICFSKLKSGQILIYHYSVVSKLVHGVQIYDIPGQTLREVKLWRKIKLPVIKFTGRFAIGGKFIAS